jgi:putative lipoic acid-binding regulatory protein
MFKFIVPQEQSHQLCAVLDMMPSCERASRSGKYVSLTLEEEMSSPEEVVIIYQKASTVPGVLAL